MSTLRQQQGFTLIELLVVVSILAAMAGIAASAMETYDQHAREQLVQTEMKTIAQGIYKFHEDTGYFPKLGVFAASAEANVADMGFLFVSPKSGGSEVLPWNAIAGRGWSGPYLTAESQQRLHIVVGGSSDCDLEAGVTISESLVALEDTFERNKTYTNTDECFAIHDNGAWLAKESAGMPYRYLTAFKNDNYPDCPDSGSGCIVLMSAGPNGEFNGGDSDDIVRLLRINP